MRINYKDLETCIRAWNAQREYTRNSCPLLKVQRWNGCAHIVQIVNGNGGVKNLHSGTTRECYEWFAAFREGFMWAEYHHNDY